jgi:hypothetical protein
MKYLKLLLFQVTVKHYFSIKNKTNPNFGLFWPLLPRWWGNRWSCGVKRIWNPGKVCGVKRFDYMALSDWSLASRVSSALSI